MSSKPWSGDGDPPNDAFAPVIVASSQREAQALIGRHYAGPEDYVRVREAGPHVGGRPRHRARGVTPPS